MYKIEPSRLDAGRGIILYYNTVIEQLGLNYCLDEAKVVCFELV